MHPKLKDIIKNIHDSYNEDTLTPIFINTHNYIHHLSPFIIQNMYFYAGTEDDFIFSFNSENKNIMLYSSSIMEGTVIFNKDFISKITPVYIELFDYFFTKLDPIVDAITALRDYNFDYNNINSFLHADNKDSDEQEDKSKNSYNIELDKYTRDDLLLYIDDSATLMNTYFNDISFARDIKNKKSKTIFLDNEGNII